MMKDRIDVPPLGDLGRQRIRRAVFDRLEEGPTAVATPPAPPRRPRRRVVLWAAADNVLDTEVEVSETADCVSGYGPPRTMRLGLRLAF